MIPKQKYLHVLSGGMELLLLLWPVIMKSVFATVTSCLREWPAYDATLLLHGIVIKQTTEVVNETLPLPNMHDGGLEGTQMTSNVVSLHSHFYSFDGKVGRAWDV